MDITAAALCVVSVAFIIASAFAIVRSVHLKRESEFARALAATLRDVDERAKIADEYIKRLAEARDIACDEARKWKDTADGYCAATRVLEEAAKKWDGVTRRCEEAESRLASFESERSAMALERDAAVDRQKAAEMECSRRREEIKETSRSLHGWQSELSRQLSQKVVLHMFISDLF